MCCEQVSEKLHGCFKKVTRKIEGCFEGVLRVFQGCLMKVSWEGSFIYVSRVFQEFFKEVSRKRSRCFKKSFMLHGTHRSFPSRRRACLIPFSLQICILGMLSKDIKKGQILEHRWSCFCSHFDHLWDIYHNRRTYNGNKFQHFMVFFDVASNIGQNANQR